MIVCPFTEQENAEPAGNVKMATVRARSNVPPDTAGLPTSPSARDLSGSALSLPRRINLPNRGMYIRSLSESIVWIHSLIERAT